MCAAWRAVVGPRGAGHHKEDQPQRISRDGAEVAGWPDDQATDSKRSTDSQSGHHPRDSIPYSWSQSESHNRQGEYILFPFVRVLVPDPFYFSYS